MRRALYPEGNFKKYHGRIHKGARRRDFHFVLGAHVVPDEVLGLSDHARKSDSHTGLVRAAYLFAHLVAAALGLSVACFTPIFHWQRVPIRWPDPLERAQVLS